MAQLSRARDRSMHSIVATIQAEQDKAIRAPGKGVVSISGGPGTGKTVVALHRAAYLLYNDRRRYESGGVLIVGPSGVFMRYIERVLPSLGETAVALRSLGEVVDGLRTVRHDDPAVADVKGSARMAELLRRAARQAVARVTATSSASSTATTSSSSTGDARAGSAASCWRQGLRNRPVPRVASALIDALWRQVRGERGRERGREEFDDEMLGNDAFVRVRGRLVAAARRRRRCWAGCATPSSSPASATAWSATRTRCCCSRAWGGDLSIEDVPLIDELRYAARRRAAARRPRTSEYADHLGARPAGADHRLRAGVRPHRPRLDAADPPRRGRHVRARAHRRGAGPHPDAVADGRPPRPRRLLDDRRRPGPVVVAGRRGVRAGPCRGARGQAGPRVPPVDELPQLLRDLRVRRGVRRAGRSRRRPADRGPLDRRAPDRARGRRRPGGGGPCRGGPARGRGGRHRRRRRTRRPPCRGERLAGVLARARRRTPRRPRDRSPVAPRAARTGSWC